VIGSDKKVKLTITYPASTGRNFEEILRVLDSFRLTAGYSVATPVNWHERDDVIIVTIRKRRGCKGEVPQGIPGGEALFALHAPAQALSRRPGRAGPSAFARPPCRARREGTGPVRSG